VIVRLREDVRLVRNRDSGQEGFERNGRIMWLPNGLASRIVEFGIEPAIPEGLTKVLREHHFLAAAEGSNGDRNSCFISALAPGSSEDIVAGVCELRMAIIGCGGLGSAVAQLAGALGVRQFVLMDGDRIETSNLNRLLFAGPRHVGEFKTSVLAGYLEKRFGASVVKVSDFADDQVDPAIFGSTDIAVVAIDQPEQSRSVIAALHGWGKPAYLQAGYVGAKCSVGPIIGRREDPCPYCDKDDIEVVTTGSVSASAGINNYFIGAYLVSQVALWIVGESALKGRRWGFDLATSQGSLKDVYKNPNCKVCGTGSS
jgi:molybdopterin-synthase adenylyltransferase